jgi:beta-lactamase class A
VSAYIASLRVEGFHLEEGERLFQTDVNRQYRNWFEPASAVQLLGRIGGDSPLTPEHTNLLLGWCAQIPVQPLRLAAALPPGTPIAHKSGSSGVEEGLARATNDIGLVTLPDGRQLAIAVFVTDSTAKDGVRDQVIARIGKAAYDAALLTHR